MTSPSSDLNHHLSIKQAEAGIFARKIQNQNYHSLTFSNIWVEQAVSQKYLDFKLNFQKQLENAIHTVNKTIRSMRKFQNILLGSSLINDYGDIISDLGKDSSFHLKLESVQHNAALAINSAIRGTSKKSLTGAGYVDHFNKDGGTGNYVALLRYKEDRSDAYLIYPIPSSNKTYQARNMQNVPHYKPSIFFSKIFSLLTIREWNNAHNISQYKAKQKLLKKTILEWNKLDLNIRSSKTFSVFLKNILKFIRPSSCSIPKGIKYITRLAKTG